MEQIKTKICTTCMDEKPVTEFYRDKAATDDYESQCKQCQREVKEATRQEKVRERRLFAQMYGL